MVADRWSVVVPRPGWRLYCLSARKGPAEFRYVRVSAVLMHDMMTLNSDQLPVPVMTIDWAG
jgi:hypothetical protein